MNDLELNFSNATELPEAFYDAAYELTLNGIIVIAADGVDTPPIPWDASVEVAGDALLLTGGVGANGWGMCTVRVPKAQAHRAYRFILEVRDAKNVQKIKDLLEPCGIAVTPAADWSF